VCVSDCSDQYIGRCHQISVCIPAKLLHECAAYATTCGYYSAQFPLGGGGREKLKSHTAKYDFAFPFEIAPYYVLPFAGGMFPVILTEHYISRFLFWRSRIHNSVRRPVTLWEIFCDFPQMIRGSIEILGLLQATATNLMQFSLSVHITWNTVLGHWINEHVSNYHSLFFSSQVMCIYVPAQSKCIWYKTRKVTIYGALYTIKLLVPFIGAFAKLPRATTSFIMSVLPSVRPSVRMEQLGSHWTDFHEIWYLNSFENLSRKVKFY
jgi:hypothetical protein